MIKKEDIKYELNIEENSSIERIQDIYYGNTIIWLSGSGCNKENINGYYRYLLQYKEHKKYYEGVVAGATANQAFLHGAIDAVENIKGEQNICLVVPTALGFEKAFMGKGVNAELIQKLLSKIFDKHSFLSEIRYINGADSIKRHIVYNSKNETLANEYEHNERKKEQYKNEYKQRIYSECLNKVEKILIDNCVDEEIIKMIKTITVD